MVKRRYHLTKGLILPKNDRQIEQLVEGSDERTISHLIPTAALTKTFPINGTAFSAIEWMNEPEPDDFEDFVMYNMTKEDGWFTRLHFVRARADQLTVPVHTFYTDGPETWFTIFNWIQFLQDRNGRVFHRYGIIPEQELITQKKIEIFVSTEPWGQNDYDDDSPGPNGISWHFKGAEGHIERCLHVDLELPGLAGTRSLGTFPQGKGPQGAGERQRFPASRHTTWQDHQKQEPVTLKDGLYYKTKEFLFAPPLGEETISH